MGKAVAVKSESHSKSYDPRYIIVDDETGEVLDDAQGYGYRTPQGAHASWSYKHRDKAKDKVKEERCAHIRQWLKKHRQFSKELEWYDFQMLKGSLGPDDKLDPPFVAKLLKEFDLKPDFSAGELLRVWEKL